MRPAVGYYTYLGWQPFTVGSSKMQMFILEINIDDHCPFSFCTCAETSSKLQKTSTYCVYKAACIHIVITMYLYLCQINKISLVGL